MPTEENINTELLVSLIEDQIMRCDDIVPMAQWIELKNFITKGTPATQIVINETIIKTIECEEKKFLELVRDYSGALNDANVFNANKNIVEFMPRLKKIRACKKQFEHFLNQYKP